MKVETLAAALIRKHQCAELFSIQRAIWIENLFAKLLRDCLQAGRTRHHDLARRLVRIQHVTPQFFKNRRDKRLTNPDRSCQADAKHTLLPPQTRGLQVFFISIATVNNPTPPGTGVNLPATSAASAGCTSPMSVTPRLATTSESFLRLTPNNARTSLRPQKSYSSRRRSQLRQA